jgi:hypothetical protein
MREKQGFFNLESKLQDRLRYFMASISILQALAFIIPPQMTTIVFTVIGVGLNLFLLYFSFSIKRAPNLYFKLITWAFLIVLIFDGLEIYRVLSGQAAFSLKSVPSFLCVALVIAIAPTLMKFRNSIKNSNSIENAS